MKKKLYKLFKIIIALLLVPFCIGAVLALYEVILKSGMSEKIWIGALSGFVVWILIYIFLPEPKWLYVLGHEVTHVLWSLPFGGKLKRIRIRASGGHVLLTKSNFLTSLSPYFFPIYVVFIIVIFNIGNFFWNWYPYVYIFYFLIGMMYGFHITFTSKILKIKQPDIVGEGYIFSAVIIFLGNALILLVGIPYFDSHISIGSSLNIWLDHSFVIFEKLKLFFLS